MLDGFFKRFVNKVFRDIFSRRKQFKLGFYGPPNAGKTTLANKICMDWLGQEIGTVSEVAHETRSVNMKENIEIEHQGKKITFSIADTPGIATKIDYEDFLKSGMSKPVAKKRAKEATKGVIEAIKWIDNLDVVVVVLDGTKDPYSQVNITIIGNLQARNIPVLIVANKTDLKKANVKKVQSAFPQYDVIGMSAKKGKGMDAFYEALFALVG
ncbi:MAG TPA: Era-like GTP-binding protein [Candidatus Nanoarchaeia archaeon]|nr:Era-like GTP-binding protein [Candidatus Nanoarchaeia archaeon]